MKSGTTTHACAVHSWTAVMNRCSCVDFLGIEHRGWLRCERPILQLSDSTNGRMPSCECSKAVRADTQIFLELTNSSGGEAANHKS